VDDDTPRIVQVVAEHYGSRADRFETPKSLRHLDVSGLAHGDLMKVVGDTKFSFTQIAHRELCFDSATALRAFSDDLASSIEGRERPVDVSQIKDYVRDRLQTRDPEWEAVAAAFPRWRDWSGG
jgi:hypothetical protein